MKSRYFLCFIFFIAGFNSYSQCFTYTVNACIDYDDYLHISGDSLWWQNFGGSPPGTHPNCNGQDVTVNGVDWFPWNSIYILPKSTSNCTMVATVIQCSDICDTIQLPTATNGWQGIYEFNDEGPSGPHNYSIQFAFYCPVVSVSADTSICAGTSANLWAAGGSTYSWSPTTSLSCSTCANPIATPTATTTYTVTATDAYNCSGTASVTVSVSPINITPASTPATCFGYNNGVASVTITGGNPALSYAWSNGPTTLGDPNLASGNYTITVTDALGCASTATVFVSQPLLLTVSATNTNVTCNGLSNGSINLTPAGGTGPNTFAWNDGNTNQNRIGLPAGIYSVTVSDSYSCTASLNDTITQPAALTASATNTNVSCNAGSDGSVTLSVAGGTMPYAFSWNDGNTNQNRLNLAAGTYMVTVTDGQTCTVTASATITQPTVLYITPVQINESCFGGNTASIAVVDTGGTAPYAWLWSDGNTNQNRNNITAGNYSVTATDSHSCTASTSVTITQPPSIAITQTHINDSCFSAADGSIALSLAGGMGPLTFLWNDGNTNQNRANLATGNYTITVTDSNSCTASLSIYISQPTALGVNANATGVKCYGGSNGSIAVTDSGGTVPYTYTWNDGIATQNRTQLTAGTYIITVTDAMLCTASASAAVIQPDSLSLAEMITNPLCPTADNNGSIVLNINGGTPPYQYTWSNGAISGSITQLTIGNYFVTVTDVNGCTADDAFTLVYEFNYTVVANPAAVLLLGQSETLTYSLIGNAGNYASIWTPATGLNCSVCDSPVTAPVFTTLYRITVQNDSGCSVSDTVTVTVIPQYDIYIPNVFTPGNNGNNNYFSIYGNKEELQYLDVSIFDRIGEKVYESHDINFAWDGTYKGVLLPLGVYVYQLKLVFIDGHMDKLRTGSVTLLR